MSGAQAMDALRAKTGGAAARAHGRQRMPNRGAERTGLAGPLRVSTGPAFTEPIQKSLSPSSCTCMLERKRTVVVSKFQGEISVLAGVPNLSERVGNG